MTTDKAEETLSSTESGSSRRKGKKGNLEGKAARRRNFWEAAHPAFAQAFSSWQLWLTLSKTRSGPRRFSSRDLVLT